MEKILSLLTRISELYNIPQWMVNSGAIAICVILLTFPFIARYLMRPKYHKYREMIFFKVLWRWKYKKGDVVGLWCYCPKCQSTLMCDDENCRSTETLQDKITYFICNECGGNELSRVVGGDRRYVLSLVKRDIWRHIKEGSFNDVATATKEALEIYATLHENKKNEIKSTEEAVMASHNEADGIKDASIPTDEAEKVSSVESNEELSMQAEESTTNEESLPAEEPNKEPKNDGI